MGFLFGRRQTISTTENKIGALRIQSSSQGLPIPIVYGQTRISSNLLWYGDFTAIPHTETQRTGKGGGGTTVSNTTYTYTTGVIFGLCEGPINGVAQLWSGKDVTTTGKLGLSVFDGTYPQTPWTYLTTNHPTQALGYQGTAYCASAALDLGGSASLPNLSFEVQGLLWQDLCNPDINVSDVFLDIMTADGYGIGFPADQIDSLAAFETYCAAAGLFISPAYTAQQSAAGVVQELAKIGNAALVWSECLLKVIPYADEVVTANTTTAVTTGNAGSFLTFANLAISTDGQVADDVDYDTPTYDLNLFNNAPWTLGANVSITALNNAAITLFEFYFVVSGSGQYFRVRSDAYAGAIGIDTSAFGQNEGGAVAFSSGRVDLNFDGTDLHLKVNGATAATVAAIGGTGVGLATSSASVRIGNTTGGYAPGLATFAASLTDITFTRASTLLTTCVAGNSVTYTPDLTVRYDLTYDDFLAGPGENPIKVTRKRQADAFNAVQVESLDRSNGYNPYVAEAKDQWNIDVYGLRPAPVFSAHAICDANVARTVAQTALQRVLYVRNSYEFTVGWRYARLEPMDVVSLTDPNLGLAQTPVRIIAIEEDEEGALHVTAEDMNIGVSSPGSYATQASGGSTVNNAVDPGDTHAPVIFQPPIALTGTPQVWIGAAGGSEWGGAQVWFSTDGSSYQMAGQISAPARYGSLTANFPSHADPDTTNTLSVDLSTSNGVLTSAANSSADAGGTLSYVGVAGAGELIDYSTANLTSAYHYDLPSYLRRAQDGSVASAHLTGADFMRLDDAVAKFDISEALFGTTIYIKLLSFNKTGGGVQSLASVSAISYVVLTQLVTDQSGYSFIVDTTSTADSNPGAGKVRFNNASEANTTTLFFNDATADGANMSTYFASAGNDGFLDLRDVADTAKWATFKFTAVVANSGGGYHKFTVAYQAGGVAFPNGDTVTLTLAPTLATGVRSVGLTMPSIFSVANSPVTTTGNFSVTLISQNAATVFAGPTSGNAAAPTFRALVAGDVPALAYTANVMTTAGDIIYGGANGAATRLPVGSNTQVLAVSNGVPAWANAAAGGIGNIGLTMPSIFSVANSPLTANGTLGVTLATQNAALVFAGPSSGNAAAPAFRALVASDMGSQNASTFLAGPSSGNAANAAFRTLAGGDMPPLTINTQTANYTLALSDANGVWVEMNSGNALVVTVPSQANVAWSGNVIIPIERLGAGNVTISSQANVTVHNSSSNTLRVQYSVAGLKRRGTDEWTLFGDTT
jgi:hypothetical protein